MRVVQLIDSLEVGGSERMAVNYANALADEIEFSGLVTTRKEGALLHCIHPNVSYLFLNKKSTVDFGALFRMRSFVLKNKVTHIHAHSTSFFLAFSLKIINPSVKLIWHLHYGGSELLSKNRLLVLRMILPFFNGIIAVNQNLKNWAEVKMNSKNVVYLPNFPSKDNEVLGNTVLKGIEGKRIVSLANLRVEKNHFLLLEVAKKMQLSYPEWTFHLVGKDFEDDYSEQIKNLILKFDLGNNVFVYGSRQDVPTILAQTAIAVLTSQIEGFPVALLEYGLYKKAVVVTRVGEIPMIIKHGKNGFIVDSNESDLFCQSLIKLIEEPLLQESFAENLHQTIVEHFSEASIIKKYIHWIRTTIINE
ncbi:glycosyltransferase [Flavobacterium sufflavum]|uniref:Glycosyltransferase n=1 Tax=Flavobacterium sufflavum TaxID=1921138 RepID=A0A3S2XHX3_9FLAO|nr:glycosyltransferase family 4 protein [Flavobacterium sufflavum]RVT75901.1 glycosyltransferase [Flavobacterium sufflavum]